MSDKLHAQIYIRSYWHFKTSMVNININTNSEYKCIIICNSSCSGRGSLSRSAGEPVFCVMLWNLYTHSNTVVVWDDAQWDKTLLPYMFTEPHTYKGIQFMFHALYITFDTIHTIRIPYTSVQSCSSYLNPYTSCNSIQFHFIIHAI